jgi:hypothetical protein
LHLRSVLTRDELFPAAQALPQGEQIRKRGYSQPWGVSHWLGYSKPASRTWIWVVQVLLLLNVLLMLYSLLEWVCVIDWDWFGPA